MARLPILVPASFIDRAEQRVVRLDISVRAGWTSSSNRLMTDCHERAHDYGYSHWVQPYAPVEGRPADWHVYRCANARTRQFLKSFTSRDAAEMWVLHHAE